MNAIKSVLAVLVAGCLVGGAFGADEAKKKKKAKGADTTAMFTKLDTDKDGKLSSAEFAKVVDELKAKKPDAAKPAKAGKKTDAMFTKLDADKNGSLSPEEFKKVLEVRKEAKAKAK